MSNYNNLILFQKIYDFLLWLYPRIEKFPKSYRLIHGKYISTSAIELLLLVIDVNVLPPNERFNKKSELSCKLDELRILLRLSKDLKILSIKQYDFAALQLNEISKIMNAWVRPKH
ncbi:hypothetical protein DOJK_01510 [Patescibacteria group bacterium]|jgi:hypothetical protein|nr:four helix bundle protein [Candidatus Dojkabacteria bacterium]CAG1022199.1 hypothetical protein DOJK_01510 [Patescibacteria group bacterium]